MSRYWIIAPLASSDPDLFDNSWQFDLENNIITIGWHELGDISQLSREALSSKVASSYSDKPGQTKGLITNMLWSFYHEISPGDLIIARRGRKVLAAAGKVISPAICAPKPRNPHLKHRGTLEVEWQSQPRDKEFPTLVFPMRTLTEITEAEYGEFLGSPSIAPISSEVGSEPIDQNAFVLEKYLEDFIVSNFATIFNGQLKIYADADGADGQQYATDIGLLDILAFEPKSNSFVVIELKKGRPSDQVVGQVLRYMGWVKKNLCKDGQSVRGLVVCREPDPKLSYAIEMTNNIDVRYYSVSFKLREAP
jgi:restriction system protein